MIVVKKRGCSDKINEYVRFSDLDCKCDNKCQATLIHVNIISRLIALTEMIKSKVNVIDCFKCQHQVADTYDKITSEHLYGAAITLECPDHMAFTNFSASCRLLFPYTIDRKPFVYCYSNRR